MLFDNIVIYTALIYWILLLWTYTSVYINNVKNYNNYKINITMKLTMNLGGVYYRVIQWNLQIPYLLIPGTSEYRGKILGPK